jgi:hypothetical protein
VSKGVEKGQRHKEAFPKVLGFELENGRGAGDDKLVMYFIGIAPERCHVEILRVLGQSVPTVVNLSNHN